AAEPATVAPAPTTAPAPAVEAAPQSAPKAEAPKKTEEPSVLDALKSTETPEAEPATTADAKIDSQKLIEEFDSLVNQPVPTEGAAKDDKDPSQKLVEE